MKRWTLALALATMALATGCQADKSMSWDYGKAYHTVFESQKFDPQAGDDSPVVGMDGAKAGLAYDRYEKAEPPKEEKRGSILNFESGK